MTAAFAIDTRALTRAFGGRAAVDGLTLRVPAGSVFGLLGPNGAGKTTTIRLLLGLLEPTSGSACVLGFDPRTDGDAIRERAGALLEHAGLYERLSAEDNLEFHGRICRLPRIRERAGALLEHAGLYERLSAEDNLEFHGRICRLPRTVRRERIDELLTHLGLRERRRDVVATWSRGMKQKLAIARAMLHRPALLFLDEPTAGLDPIAAAALRDDLAALVSREHVTVFLTTHNLAEAEALCAQVGVLRAGKLLAVGTPQEVRSGRGPARVEIAGRRLNDALVSMVGRRLEVRSVSVVHPGARLAIELLPGADIAGVVAAIVGGGGEVEEVRRGPATLEDAFRTLVEEAV
jgi:ABC-2 type transport system ATP-binding protein